VFHTGPKSANAYIVENSYGRNSYSGKTYGPFNYNMSGCDFQGLGDAIRPMIPDKCDHYGYVLAPNQKSCGWAGIAESGTAAKPVKDTWYNAIDIGTLVQENMHNRGVSHASSITCTGGPFADNLSGCRHDEYGDHFDVMGLGQRHMHAWPKLYMGWFGGCNLVKVTSSGTFNLLPIAAACEGVQALQIPFPGGKTRPFSAGGETLTTYYVEYRSSLGVDTGMTPQIFIHAAPNTVANTKTNPNSWLLNVSGNSKNPGLVAGGSFSDPAGGLTITVTGIDSQKATVQVDYPGGTGAPACLDGTSLTPPGPVDCIGTVTPDGGTGPIPDSGSAGAGGGGRDAGGTGGGRDAGSNAGAGGGGPSDAGASGGSAGATSSGGAAGSATAGSGGSAGSSQAGGAGGSSVGAGGSRRPGAGSGELDGGCSCRIGAPSTPSRAPLAALALGLSLSLVTRRRKRT
jgi:MYXO-CTERM domain-containing protein